MIYHVLFYSILLSISCSICFVLFFNIKWEKYKVNTQEIKKMTYTLFVMFYTLKNDFKLVRYVLFI